MKIHVAFVIFILKNEIKMQETQSLSLKSDKSVEPLEACFGFFDIIHIFLRVSRFASVGTRHVNPVHLSSNVNQQSI